MRKIALVISVLILMCGNLEVKGKKKEIIYSNPNPYEGTLLEGMYKEKAQRRANPESYGERNAEFLPTAARRTDDDNWALYLIMLILKN